VIGDFWLQRPAVNRAEAEDELEEAYRRLQQADGGWLDDRLPVSIWEFLCWLTDVKGLVLHGSAAADIEVFEPRTPNDRSADDFSKQTAVFAASDGIWPLFYAILDRRRSGLRFLNGALQFELSPGRLTQMHYFFSVTEEILAARPWRSGVIYLLPRGQFVQQEPYQLAGRLVHEPHWASPAAVRPLARLRVTPEDFPFLDQVRGHDPALVDRLAVADPEGFPWLTR
jgi:hypothetical protein